MKRANTTWVINHLDPNWNTLPSRPSWEEVAPDLLLLAGTANSYVLRTDEGLLIIDPGHERHQQDYVDVIRQWSSDPITLVAYTHGHTDHVSSFQVFLDAGADPEVIAQENSLKRFARYEAMHGFNQHINRRQFASPDLTFPSNFLRPTTTFRDSLTRVIGHEELRFRAVKGETDDYCYIWMPKRRILFVGDMATWKIPNSGNPLKLQRYPVEWVDALEEMAALGAEWLCPGHDLILHGIDCIRTMLQAHALYLRSLITQVCDRMNEGQSYDEILHSVSPDPELSQLPYLRSVYNHPQFIVRDLLRYWGGWWDGIGSHLLPAPIADQAREIMHLAGGVIPLIQRARQLAQDGQLELACHLIDWSTQAEPDNIEAQKGKRDIYRLRAAHASANMAKGFFLTEALDAEQVIGQLHKHAEVS